MATNPLKELNRLGQSFWYDNIRREFILSGELQTLVDRDGLSGLTSNPTIFEKAISGSTDYDAALKSLAGLPSAAEIFEAIAVEDIQMAADLMRPAWERTKGEDGYVSIEVSPGRARDTRGTIEEARRLWMKVGRPNLLVKIPGTVEGLPAIEDCLAEGININVTLLFSVERYGKVIEAYLRALERRARDGRPLEVASVASFFVSRVDTAADKLLEQKIAASKDEKAKGELESLLGKAAVANAKLAYELFEREFASKRFKALAKKGARVQRPLWASTSTKNPHYRDVMYVEPLIGPHTVNTMPPATIDAFRDHGVVKSTVAEGLKEAKGVLDRLERAGISLADVTRRLEEEGVKSFSDSFDSLMKGIASKREMLRAGAGLPYRASLGEGQKAFASAMEELKRKDFARRLAAKDPELWKSGPEHAKIIKNALGWLDAADVMQGRAAELAAFAEEIRAAGFTHALVLGMGGSSLAPEVLRRTFGPRKGRPELLVLDTTDPAAVARLGDGLDCSKVLFIVASKSGGTIEPNSFLAYFWEKVKSKKGAKAGENFVAITDPGTAMEKLAREKGFRRVFLNMADIGGRYSALSYFGMLPAALSGLDVRRFFERAEAMREGSSAAVPAEHNPGLWLGAVLGGLARQGRDKVTFACSPGLSSFGLWLEQLLAESTGKEGKGLVPVAGEPLADPSAYGKDRLFVAVALKNEAAALEPRLKALEAAGHPVARLTLDDAWDLGAEFLRWELATAAAGCLLGIDAFDQPNVQEAKDGTNALLSAYASSGRLSEEPPALVADARGVTGGPEDAAAKPEKVLADFAAQARPGDYLGLLAYVDPTPEAERWLAEAQAYLRDTLRIAVTAGFGPRYLHSTGQLHKGGPNKGLFIVVTSEAGADAPIPGQKWTFGVLEKAQALGDVAALKAKGRRVLRVHLRRSEGLAKLAAALRAGVREAVKA